MFSLKSYLTFMTTFLIVGAQVVEGAWSTPIALSTTTSDQPDIAVDINGNAVAMWQGFDGSNYVVQAASLPQGGSWSIPTTLSASGQNAQDPEVGLDKNGNAVAIWSRFDGFYSIIQSAALPLGGNWSTVVDVSSSGANADSCELAVDSTGFIGDAVAVWHRYNGSNFVVQASTLPSGGSWSAPADMTPSGQDALVPAVAMDPFGNAISTSSRYDGASFTTRASTKLIGQSWNANFVLSNPGDSANQPFITVDQLGNGVAVWSQFDGSNYVIKASTLLFGGAWTSPVDLSQTGEDAYDPIAAADGSGNIFVLWVRYDGANYVAQTADRNFLGIWSSASTISASGQDVGYTDLKVDATGNAIAVWDIYDGDNSVIESVSRPQGGSWSSAAAVSTGLEYAYFPVVDVDASGNAVAIWIESNGSADVVMASSLPFGS